MNALNSTLWAAAIITVALCTPVAQSARADDAVPAAPAAKADIPLGSPDFYPSDERPVGYRGDGSGNFAGATVVSEWWDGTPSQKDLPAAIKTAKATKYWDLDETAPKNIVWKTQMPSWANTPPLVVGDKVFTLGEFWKLYCVDANTGKLLWTESCSPWDAAGLDKPLVTQMENLYEIQQAAMGLPYRMYAFNTVTRGIPVEEAASLFTDYEKDVPKMLEGLKQYDPDNMAIYEAASKKTLLAMEPLRKPEALPLRNIHGFPRAIDTKGIVENDIRAFDQAILKRILLLGKIKPSLQQPWGNMVGFCMQSPVSDGKRVYARWYQGQMVCLDLDGKRLWAKFDESCGANPINGDCGSPPVLVDKYVMVTYPSIVTGRKTRSEGVKAYDKITGEEKWTYIGGGGSPGVNPAKPMLLRNGDTTCGVLLLRDNNIIIRIKDGAFLGKLTPEGTNDYKASSVVAGDIIFRGVNCGKPISAFRLTLKDDNTVGVEKVYDTNILPHFTGIIVTDKYLIGHDTVEIKTGTVVGPQAVGKARDRERATDILCGNLRISCGDAGGGMLAWGPTLDHGWGGRRFDGKSLLPFTVEDITDPAKQKVLSAKNFLGGDFQPLMPWYQQWSPALYANPNYFDKSTEKPGHVMYQDTGAFAEGNRLFIRTVGYLYCIGDPKVPYNWNPESRPKG